MCDREDHEKYTVYNAAPSTAEPAASPLALSVVIYSLTKTFGDLPSLTSATSKSVARKARRVIQMCMHHRYKTDYSWAWRIIAIYALLSIFLFRLYMARFSDEVIPYSGSIFGTGHLTSHFLAMLLILAAGIFVFAVAPKEKTCIDCGFSWK